MLLKLLSTLFLSLPLIAAEIGSCSAYEGGAERIYGASPPVNYLLYALDPELMVGLNFPLRQREAGYLKQVEHLPVIGGWFGQGRTPNFETLAKVKPELTIAWNYRGNFGRIAKALNKLGLPSCAMALDRLEDYPGALRTLGHITKREARAEALASDFETRLQKADAHRASIGTDVEVRVYYAEGVGGLKTECSGSVHAELIERAGGVNVHQCTQTSGYGMEQITIEQLMLYDPDVIIAFEKEFFKNVYSDSRFSRLKAVREHRVHLIPSAPINWFDRPPSFMRIAGLEWLQWVLHGGSEEELTASLQSLFRLYYGEEPDAQRIRELVGLSEGASS